MEQTNKSFYNLGVAPGFLQALEKMKITVPTPIQYKALPPAIEGKDVIGIAQSGTGKTIAFGIPMMQRLAQSPGRGLIIAPTRELAIQVAETLRAINQMPGMEVVVIIGGVPIVKQLNQLKRNPRIIVATPGRLMDHLDRRRNFLSDVKIVVLDEADCMLDMGFEPAINLIMKSISPERQTMLFSATMPEEIVKIANSYMRLPVSVEIAPAGSIADKIAQELFIVDNANKDQLMAKLLEQYRGTVLLFVRTKIGTMKLKRKIKALGHRAAEIHSDRTLSQRREALEGFKSGKYRILVATDVAARGIDVTGIELVINYDLPDDAESYVHRIGRTARAGREGHAISFAMPDQLQGVRSIERLTKITLPISKHPDVPSAYFSRNAVPRQRGNYGRRGNSGFSKGRRFGSGRFNSERKTMEGYKAYKSGNSQRPAFGNKDSRPKSSTPQNNNWNRGNRSR